MLNYMLNYMLFRRFIWHLQLGDGLLGYGLRQDVPVRVMGGIHAERRNAIWNMWSHRARSRRMLRGWIEDEGEMYGSVDMSLTIACYDHDDSGADMALYISTSNYLQTVEARLNPASDGEHTSGGVPAVSHSHAFLVLGIITFTSLDTALPAGVACIFARIKGYRTFIRISHVYKDYH